MECSMPYRADVSEPDPSPSIISKYLAEPDPAPAGIRPLRVFRYILSITFRHS